MSSVSGSKKQYILPPPELRKVVDRAADFVARNGPAFEERIRENERNNSKFSFLQLNDPYRPYYDTKVLEYKLGKLSEETSQGQFISEKVIEEVEQKMPPNESYVLDFLTETPALSLVDSDIIKLTALFAARNGRSFLSSLVDKEGRNYQFDFLKPQHSLYPYFSKLVEEYGRVLIPSDERISRLLQISETPHQILQNAEARAEYLSYRNSINRESEERVQKEKEFFDSIDWHDFVIVETLQFELEDGQLELPIPIQLQNLLSMSLTQRRDGIVPQTTSVASPSTTPLAESRDMEVDMDMELNEEPFASTLPVLSVSTPQLQPNYIPRALAMKQGAVAAETMQICPRCLQKIPLSKLDEHLRLELLDPKWKEQKQVYLDKHRESNVLQTSLDVSRNLQKLAGKRSDIFGKEERTLEASTPPLMSSPFPFVPSLAAPPLLGPTFVRPSPSMIPSQAVTPTAPFHGFVPSQTGFPVLPPPPYGFPLPPPPSQPQPPQPQLSSLPINDETIRKKSKVESLSLCIQIPLDQNKSEWQLHGQTLIIPFDSEEPQTIDALKNKIAERIGLPNSRQKLSLPGNSIVLKNTQSFDELGLINGWSLVLSLKERGGKR